MCYVGAQAGLELVTFPPLPPSLSCVPIGSLCHCCLKVAALQNTYPSQRVYSLPADPYCVLSILCPHHLNKRYIL